MFTDPAPGQHQSNERTRPQTIHTRNYSCLPDLEPRYCGTEKGISTVFCLMSTPRKQSTLRITFGVVYLVELESGIGLTSD